MAGEDRLITVQFMADLAPLSAAFAEVNAQIATIGKRQGTGSFATELEAGMRKADVAIAETSKQIDAVIAKKAPARNFATELNRDVKQLTDSTLNLVMVEKQATAEMQAAAARANTPIGAGVVGAGVRRTLSKEEMAQFYPGLMNPGAQAATSSAVVDDNSPARVAARRNFFENMGQGGELSGAKRGGTKEAAEGAKEAAAELRAGSIAEKEFAKGAGDIETAIEGAGRGTRNFTNGLRAMRPDLMLVIGAVAGVAKVFQEFATEQSSETQLKAILGPAKQSAAAMEGLAKAADSQNFKASEYNDVAKSLKIAGIQTSDLTGDVRALGEASRISNVPMASLAKEVINAQEHSTGSLESMMLITEATSGATQKLTNAYREIPYALEMANRALTINSEKQEWAFKKVSEQRAASSALANKKTLKDDQGQAISPGDKAYKDFQGDVFGSPTVYGFEGSWGQTKLLKDEQRKLKEGYAQMKKEYGPSTFGETQGMVQSGAWSKEDLLSAAERARGKEQEDTKHGESLQKRDMGYAAEDKQRALYAEAVADLTVQTGALAEARRAAAEAEKSSAQGIGEAAAAEINKKVVTAGKVEYEATQLPGTMGKDWGTAMQKKVQEYQYGMTYKLGTDQLIAASPAEHNKTIAQEQANTEMNRQRDLAYAYGFTGKSSPVTLDTSGRPIKADAKLEDAKTHDLLSQLNTTLQRIFGPS